MRHALRSGVAAALLLVSGACAGGEPETRVETAAVGDPVLVPAFTATVDPVTAGELWASWRPGCPVPVEDLRRVTVTYLGFDGQTRQGTLILHHYHARNVVAVFSELYAARFPIQQMVPVEAFGGDDDASMAANNTSAFNCRAVTGGTRFSEHSYGWAIDINPVQNPYVSGSTVLPPSGQPYVARTGAPGQVMPGDAATTHFAGINWSWGGNWTSPKDYQHFSATGR